MKNVPPSEKLHKEIDEILSGHFGKDEDLLGLMIERSLKMMFQKTLEQEVKDYLAETIMRGILEAVKAIGIDMNRSSLG